MSILKSLVELKLGDVVVKVERIGVGQCSSLLYVLPRNDLLHSHFHFLRVDGVLNMEEKEYCFTLTRKTQRTYR